MKFMLLTALLGLACPAVASVPLAGKEAQVAALMAINKSMGVSASTSKVTAFLEELATFASARTDPQRISRRPIHAGLLQGAAEVALIKLNVNKDLTPIEALLRHKEMVASSNVAVSFRSLPVDVLVDLLSSEAKVAKLLVLSGDLAPPTDTDDLDLPPQ